MSLQQQPSGAADEIAKSSALWRRVPCLPSWAFGLARRKFSIGVLTPKMAPMGSVSDTYSPMPAPESAEETPGKCRDDAKSTALLERMTQNPQPFWRGAPAAAAWWGCRRNRKILSPFETCPMPAQLGLWAGQTKIFNRGFGAQNGANGVRFGYVQPDAGTRIRRGDPEKMSG